MDSEPIADDAGEWKLMVKSHPASGNMRGSNQATVRNHNERLVLHLVRRRGVLTKAEATRETGLSPNAVSMIFNALEEEDLLLRGQPLRGRIGQPSVPYRLNPDARYYLGLKIGRRSFDLLVVDFCGAIRSRRTQYHAFPTPTATIAFVKAELPGLLRSARIGKSQISGTGVAMPSLLWQWTSDFDASQHEMDAWKGFDAVADLKACLPGQIVVENDGTAACRAEWVFSVQPDRKDSIYFFIGTFIGGGVILNGSVFRGCRGNAGGFGPLRVPDEPGGTRLIDHASLIVLERMLREWGAQGHARPEPEARDPEQVEDWTKLEPVLSMWIDRAARSLAHAIVSSAAVIDFEDVIIDGSMPASVRARLVHAVDNCLNSLDLQGIIRPLVQPGSLGSAARSLGAASLQISSRFMIEGPLNSSASSSR
jgi:predicted NBD/HSP70 family sugar kinase